MLNYLSESVRFALAQRLEIGMTQDLIKDGGA